MKILAIGAGSMGRRRLRDLIHLQGREQIVLFDANLARCAEVAQVFGVRSVSSFEAGLAERPEAITVSTPPSLHEPYVTAAMQRNLHVFAEVPFVMDEAKMAEVAERARTYPKVIGISCSTRFYPPFRLARELIERQAIGRPLYFEYSLGNYLPAWHPYEDYRTFYAGDASQGGLGFDMIFHEMLPIQSWLGPVASLQARLTRLSDLEINGPDSHDLLLTFASGCRGFFHHDVLERGTLGRHMRIVGDLGTLEWHQNQDTLRYYDGRENQAANIPFSQVSDWDDALAASNEVGQLLARQKSQSGNIPSGAAGGFNYESCYLREMKHFVGAISGRHPYTMATTKEELHSVRVFHTMLRSDAENRELQVEALTA